MMVDRDIKGTGYTRWIVSNYLTRETTRDVQFAILHTNPLLKKGLHKKKAFAPFGSKCLLFGENPFLEGKQEQFTV